MTEEIEQIIGSLQEAHFKVRSMKSKKSGREVANQFILTGRFENKDFAIFQSYNSLIAIEVGGQITLDKNDWDYSRTTNKYRNDFLGENTQETRKKIESGEYLLAELN